MWRAAGNSSHMINYYLSIMFNKINFSKICTRRAVSLKSKRHAESGHVNGVHLSKQSNQGGVIKYRRP